ncbi:inhibitor of KinA [Bacillus ectoiniformans]|uniref:5-oxoprolinase subunit PxpB n=1 Tax=Bacillus ectoiniformans TaxID=1494429 RepID=UPI00195C3548|nr:5-oxoprolinase subunit PxpB [Bacillus ectoiniformans]MBM7647350.1 inhibitor of KinA [Bacillus ectoiniformans]
MIESNIYPLGDKAVTVQFGSQIDKDTHKIVRTFVRHLETESWPGVLEWVPAFTSVTLYYDPMQTDLDKLTDHIQQDIQQMEHEEEEAPRLLEIPVCYGGELGKDLEYIADYHQMTTEEVIKLHTEPEYIVYMIGFAPGFPYIGGLSPKLATPRKTSPDLRIPAGSVAIGGQQTGVYPIESPGGWHIIGQTPWELFNPGHQPPSLLRAGDRIKFTPIDFKLFEQERGKTPWE